MEGDGCAAAERRLAAVFPVADDRLVVTLLDVPLRLRDEAPLPLGHAHRRHARRLIEDQQVIVFVKEVHECQPLSSRSLIGGCPRSCMKFSETIPRLSTSVCRG